MTRFEHHFSIYVISDTIIYGQKCRKEDVVVGIRHWLAAAAAVYAEQR